MQGGRFVGVPLASAKDAQNHLRLAEALAAYAAQLDAIVSASDGDQLEAAAADAGAAAQSLRDKLVAADPKAKPLNIGPIASFIGTGLQLALEARRFAILKNVAGRADPVVQASQRSALDLCQPALLHQRASSRHCCIRKSRPCVLFPIRAGNRSPRVWTEATARSRPMLRRWLITPGDVFKAVADAHHDLVVALNDPSRQIDALKKSIATLSAKAKALADVLKASETKTNQSRFTLNRGDRIMASHLPTF